VYSGIYFVAQLSKFGQGLEAIYQLRFCGGGDQPGFYLYRAVYVALQNGKFCVDEHQVRQLRRVVTPRSATSYLGLEPLYYPLRS